MAKYTAKADVVDAVEFTSELGAEIAAASEKKEPHATGATFEPGRGYRVNGQTISFGDWLVTSRGNTIAMGAKQFRDTYVEGKGGK
jgi:hypothetical protein